MAENTPAPPPENTAPAKAKAEDEAKRYAAYDLTRGRFTGGVHDTKKDAAAVAKSIKDAGREAEVREV